MLGDLQYPTILLPIGVIVAVIVVAAVWPAERFSRAVVALCLITLVIVGYLVLPDLLDVDHLIGG